MRTTTPRQKHLYLIARLYELAAEFSVEELQSIRSSLTVAEEDPGIRRAVDALIRLHDVAQENSPRFETPRNIPKIPERTAHAFKRPGMSVRYLEELFGNKDIFPRVQNISEIIPGGLTPQPKEGRARFVKRAIRYVSELDEKGKESFKQALAVKLEKQPNSFIFQWKTLIKEL